MKLNARQLREVDEKEVQNRLKTLKRRPIYFILENIYDTYNTGGLFRLADALSIKKIYLCGEMETPPNHKIKKASIGTYKIVPWEYKRSSKGAIAELRNSEFRVQSSKLNLKSRIINSKSNSEFITHNSKLSIIAVEQSDRAISYTKADYSLPLAFIFGNETYGILPETLKLANTIVEIPMWGINKSLNVIVSAAIVSYWAVRSF